MQKKFLKKSISNLLKSLDNENNQIIAAVGRFGPYLKYKDKLVSLPKSEDPFTIDVDKALQVVKNKIERESQSPKLKKAKYPKPK